MHEIDYMKRYLSRFQRAPLKFNLGSKAVFFWHKFKPKKVNFFFQAGIYTIDFIRETTCKGIPISDSFLPTGGSCLG